MSELSYRFDFYCIVQSTEKEWRQSPVWRANKKKQAARYIGFWTGQKIALKKKVNTSFDTLSAFSLSDFCVCERRYSLLQCNKHHSVWQQLLFFLLHLDLLLFEKFFTSSIHLLKLSLYLSLSLFLSFYCEWNWIFPLGLFSLIALEFRLIWSATHECSNVYAHWDKDLVL